MVKYFQGGKEEAKKYTRSTHQKIYPLCPDCGNIRHKPVMICNIHKHDNIWCECGDGVSYPNKFSYALLKQLPIENWETEYSPDWIKPYRYDNYFEYNNNRYIVEMDGELGHGNIEYGTWGKDIKGKERDEYKDLMAIKHNIKVIRIDCVKPCSDYIKNNILQSEIANIFDLKDVDWIQCDRFALKNLIKEICEFWTNNNHPDYSIIKNEFGIKCDQTITKYLKNGTKHGWCNYNGDNRSKKRKRINVYDINHTYLGTFESIKELSEKSFKLFGIFFTTSGISNVCRGVHNTHKNHIFEWAD